MSSDDAAELANLKEQYDKLLRDYNACAFLLKVSGFSESYHSIMSGQGKELFKRQMKPLIENHIKLKLFDDL